MIYFLTIAFILLSLWLSLENKRIQEEKNYVVKEYEKLVLLYADKVIEGINLWSVYCELKNKCNRSDEEDSINSIDESQIN